VRDRAGLVAAAGEAYGASNEEHRRLLGAI
jgi:hypothetical protein